MVTEKMKHQCSESLQYLLLTVPAALWNCCTLHRSSFWRWWWEGATAQQLSCKLYNLWTTLVAGALCSQERAVSRMTHFLRDCSMQGPGLTVVFGAAGFVYCGLSRGSACVTPWLSYSPTMQLELSTFGLQGVHCLRLHQLQPFSVFALHFSLDSSRTLRLNNFILGS